MQAINPSKPQTLRDRTSEQAPYSVPPQLSASELTALTPQELHVRADRYALLRDRARRNGDTETAARFDALRLQNRKLAVQKVLDRDHNQRK